MEDRYFFKKVAQKYSKEKLKNMKKTVLVFIVSTIFLSITILLFGCAPMHLAIYLYLPILFLVAIPIFFISIFVLVGSIFKLIRYSNNIKVYQVILPILLMVISIWFLYLLISTPISTIHTILISISDFKGICVFN
jgi:hypothetical protein